MLKQARYKSELFLLKIGNYLRTDIRYIAKQGSWLMGGAVINNILSLVLIIAFANLLPVSTYGTYKYILSIYGILSLFGLSGAGPAIIKSVAEGNENIFKPILRLQIKWGFVGSICLILVSAYYFLQGNDLFGYGFIIAAIFLPFFESLNTYLHILAGKKRFDLQTKFYSITRIVSALSLIVTLLITKNVLVILLVYFLPYIISNLIFGRLSLSKLGLNNHFDPSALTYTKHLSLINVLAFGANYLNGIIIFHYLGPVQLAIYSIASAPPTQLQSFFGIIPELSLPKYAEIPIEEIKKTIINKIFKAMFICTGIVFIFVAFVPFLFNWFLPQYIDSIFYTQLLAIPLIWYPLVLLSRVLQAKQATKYILRVGIIVPIMQVVVMFTSIYFYGLMGAVIGNIIVSAASYPVLYYYFRKL